MKSCTGVKDLPGGRATVAGLASRSVTDEPDLLVGTELGNGPNPDPGKQPRWPEI